MGACAHFERPPGASLVSFWASRKKLAARDMSRKNKNFPGGEIWPRPCLKIGNVPDGEGFFARQGDLTRQYFVYCKENQRSMAEKDPPFGHINIFRTWPSTGSEESPRCPPPSRWSGSPRHSRSSRSPGCGPGPPPAFPAGSGPPGTPC